jgi:O-antigen/teichoic acid export membrane protein
MSRYKRTIAFLNQTGFRRYGANAAWLLGERVLRMFVGLFVGIWIARYLGTEQFGLFNYAQSLVALFASIANLGIDGILIRQLVMDESKKDVLLGTAFVLKFIGGIAVILVLAIVTHFIYTDIIVLIIAGATVFQSFSVIDLYFQSKVLSRYVVFANIISLLISSVIKIILILNKAPLIAFAWMVVFDGVVLSGGLLFFYLQKKLSIVKWRFNKQKAAELLKESWPLILAGMASIINMRMDQVILGNMTNNSVVGNYAAAIRVAELWLLLPVVIGSSIFPAIISAKKISKTLYRERVVKTIKYMSFFAIPFALFVSLFSSEIINILYGKQYSESGLYLTLYIWTGLPYVVFFVLSQVCLIEKIIKLSTYVSVFVVILNIILNFVLIPKYGGVGAVIASLIAAYIGQFLMLVIIQRKTKVFSRVFI